MNLSSEYLGVRKKNQHKFNFFIKNPTIKFEFDFEFVKDYVLSLIDEMIEMF